MKKIIILLVIIIVGFGVYYTVRSPEAPVNPSETASPTPISEASRTPEDQDKTRTVLGTSVEGREIVAHHFGEGSDELLFVGGIHGGYEWNTVLVAYEIMDFIKANPSAIPANIKVTVVPVLNPDGLNKVVGTSERFVASEVPTNAETLALGRFNGNTVDLNRNFDCDWQKEGKWQSKTVSGGSSAFSEPEAQAIKNYIEKSNPKAVVVYYSAAGGVYASSCHNGVSAETSALTKAYADASGYPAYQSFDFYEITGDMVNWLAKENIPAISVLLTNHTDTEWVKNEKGFKAVLQKYSTQQ